MNPPNQVVAVLSLDITKLKHEVGAVRRLDGLADVLNNVLTTLYPAGTIRFDYLYLVEASRGLEEAIAEQSTNLHTYAVDTLGEACHDTACTAHGSLGGGHSFGVQQGHA